MNSSSLKSSSRNSICPCGGKTTKKQVSSVLLPFHIDYNRDYWRYRIRRVFRLFFIPTFVPYFKWILLHSKERERRKTKLGAENIVAAGVR